MVTRVMKYAPTKACIDFMLMAVCTYSLVKRFIGYIIFNANNIWFLSTFQGVEVLIDVETYEYFSVHSAGSEGVLVLIQHYRDIPLMRKESFVLSPGHEADVGLRDDSPACKCLFLLLIECFLRL